MKQKRTRRGFFDYKFFNSAIQSQDVKVTEQLLGYLVGPIGALILNATLTAYLNLYYTDVLGLIGPKYSLFLTLFPIASTALIVAANILIGTLIDKTKTKQGKARPYILIAGPLLALTCFFVFAVPQSTIVIKLIWVVVSYNLYYSLANAMYMMSHSLMVPLSTRSMNQRGKLSIFASVANMGAAGLFAAILFPMLILPFVGVDQTKWVTVMGILSAIALFTVLLEYYFTRERISEESYHLTIQPKIVPIKKQLKAILTEKYWWIMISFYLIFQAGSVFKNNTLVYYSNYILGSYNDGITQTSLAFLSGIPLAVGVLFIWPLANKFGKKNVAVAGYIISVAGGILCWIAPTNFIIVLIGQTIKAVGGVPGIYIMMALFADVLDHLEYKNGFRCDGLSMALYSSIIVAMGGVCMGLFNLMLSKANYVAPMLLNGETAAFTQNEAVQSVITWGFIGVEVIGHFLLIVLLSFLKVEKNMDKKQKVIQRRKEENEQPTKVLA